MGTTQLHQALRTLCFDTDWKYAVFWKLAHRSRMMLTWEDAYYDNHEQRDPSENKCPSVIVDNFWEGCYSHDPLELAVANMSYHVYSLGEGIVGQVAVTGKHMWIIADKHVTDACSSLECCDGWQSQFSAGIRTVVVVAVVPHGVVQLGSLDEIAEDLQLVNRIRNIFLALQDSSIPSVLQCGTKTSICMSNISRRSSGSESFDDCMSNLDGILNKDMFPTLKKPGDCSYIIPLPGGHPKKTFEVIDTHVGLDYSLPRVCGNADSLRLRSEIFLGNQQNQVGPNFLIDNKCDNSGLDNMCVPSNQPDSAALVNQKGVLCIPETFDLQIQKDVVKNLEFQTEFRQMDALDMSFKFSAGYELYEALGPSFGNQNLCCDWEAGKTANEIGSSSLLMADSENLLDAVVGNVCCSSSDVKSEKSFSKSVQSLLETDKISEPTCDKHVSVSSGYSFDQSFDQAFPSTSVSACSEQLERRQEPVKGSRKRARPGENCRPRPRDRQLIQERIKELRELIPNGSKCSIDSLLERTIKHMLFLQSITKHAEKLSKCTELKLRKKETGIQGFPSCEQGSSWAVEVGNQLKVCPIRVENINMNGQMVIEMLCEECCHFLELAEAVRSLGLTILKGVMEDYDEKTWISFVVEPTQILSQSLSPSRHSHSPRWPSPEHQIGGASSMRTGGAPDSGGHYSPTQDVK